MKLIALGDTHGRENWKHIVNKEEFDKVVFIGDYFDTHEHVSTRQQINNFKDIIEFKRAFGAKVVLLFGNHDFHYLRNAGESYSGYQPLHAIDIAEQLHRAIDEKLMQMCFIHQNYLFSHAGVTKTWCKNILGNANITDSAILEKAINDMFFYQPSVFKFTPGEQYDMYGDEICQTPIWVRPKSLKADRLEGFIQVVGHTVNQQITPGDGIVMIDTLGTSGEYLILENGVSETGLWNQMSTGEYKPNSRYHE